MINIYKFIGKKDKTYELEQKLNSNCPASEKSGTGPGSCGGNDSKGSKPLPPIPPKGTTVPGENVKSITHLGKDIDQEDFDKSTVFSSRNHNKSAEVYPSKNGKDFYIRDETGKSVLYTQNQFKNPKETAILNAKNYVARGKGKLEDPEASPSPAYAMQLRSKRRRK